MWRALSDSEPFAIPAQTLPLLPQTNSRKVTRNETEFSHSSNPLVEFSCCRHGHAGGHVRESREHPRLYIDHVNLQSHRGGQVFFAFVAAAPGCMSRDSTGWPARGCCYHGAVVANQDEAENGPALASILTPNSGPIPHPHVPDRGWVALRCTAVIWLISISRAIMTLRIQHWRILQSFLETASPWRT